MNGHKTSIVIKLIVSRDKKDSKPLDTILSEIIKKKWSQAEVLLKSDEMYWKYDDRSVMIYGISHETLLKVKDCISLFDVTWYFPDGHSSIGISQLSEEVIEGIWSKNVHINETFLFDWIEWVHVYRWEE